MAFDLLRNSHIQFISKAIRGSFLGKEHRLPERRQQILETIEKAGKLSVAELSAYFDVSEVTIRQDLQALSEQGIIVPLRSQQRDIGRALTHRVQAVELYLKRYTFTQIGQRIRHSLSSIANYVITFTLVVAHTRDGRSVDDTAFLMQISPSLVRVYRELYERYNTPEYRERIDGIIATVKRRGFRPSQLEQESEPNEAKKGGPRR